MEMVNIPRFTRTKNDLKSTEKRAFKISGIGFYIRHWSGCEKGYMASSNEVNNSRNI